jgi:NAD(P)-dependent dehydrogenase (short-subunit alcohol dehydrogenase family)
LTTPKHGPITLTHEIENNTSSHNARQVPCTHDTLASGLVQNKMATVSSETALNSQQVAGAPSIGSGRLLQLAGALISVAFPSRVKVSPQHDIVAVTGGSSGLGAAIAAELASRHIKTAVIDRVTPRDSERIQGVTYYTCDVTNADQLRHVAGEIRWQLGVVSVLINNAAVLGSGSSSWSVEPESVADTLGINLVANWNTVQTFIPGMLALRRGYIVNIASTLAYASPAYLSAYGASKAGLVGFHESLTAELGGHGRPRTGVHTLLVVAGQINTPLTSHITTPSQRLAPVQDPKSVASTVVNALQSGRIGEVNVPLYARFVSLLRVLPWQLSDMARAISGLDIAARPS